MSLIISVYAREGIVMAADSRLTLTFPRTLPDGKQHTVSVTSSDSAKKLFLTANHVGISTYGVADVKGVPIAGFVESFIVDKLKGGTLGPEEVAQELINYFSGQGISQATAFHVAGYVSQPAGREQRVFHVDLSSGASTRVDQAKHATNWGGEADVLQRLLNDVAPVVPAGQPQTPLPTFGIPFQFFTLQDAIDFAVYAIRTTIDTLRFQAREKTVGGPIDVLVITPDNARWIAQKQLMVP